MPGFPSALNILITQEQTPRRGFYFPLVDSLLTWPIFWISYRFFIVHCFCLYTQAIKQFFRSAMFYILSDPIKNHIIHTIQCKSSILHIRSKTADDNDTRTVCYTAQRFFHLICLASSPHALTNTSPHFDRLKMQFHDNLKFIAEILEKLLLFCIVCDKMVINCDDCSIIKSFGGMIKR